MSVLKSAESGSLYDELTVKYRVVEALGLSLRAELTERVVDEEAGIRVRGAAKFTGWRERQNGGNRTTAEQIAHRMAEPAIRKYLRCCVVCSPPSEWYSCTTVQGRVGWRAD